MAGSKAERPRPARASRCGPRAPPARRCPHDVVRGSTAALSPAPTSRSCPLLLHNTRLVCSPRARPAALVEALMGFQFNHVGGGTKTRRPITLHMKYNSACVQPNCYLLTEEFGEQEATLEELQVGTHGSGCGGRPIRVLSGRAVHLAVHACTRMACVQLMRAPALHRLLGCAPERGAPLHACIDEHACDPAPLPPPPSHQDYIENENARLDREAQFWSKEIVVRIEYKFCPNLTIIDTPGEQGASVGGPAARIQGDACTLAPPARARTCTRTRAHHTSPALPTPPSPRPHLRCAGQAQLHAAEQRTPGAARQRPPAVPGGWETRGTDSGMS